MGKIVLLDAFVEVNAVDLSDHASSVTIESAAEEVDVTAFGANAREILPGLKDATWTVSFFQDFDSGSVDATLWPLHNDGTTFTIKAREDATAAVSSTNPEYSATVALFTYSPLAGAVGEASTTEVSFRNASQAGTTRSTA